MVEIGTTKLCRGCGTEKPIDAFGTRRRTENGRLEVISRCRICVAERQRKLRAGVKTPKAQKQTIENVYNSQDVEILKPEYWAFIKPEPNRRLPRRSASPGATKGCGNTDVAKHK